MCVLFSLSAGWASQSVNQAISQSTYSTRQDNGFTQNDRNVHTCFLGLLTLFPVKAQGMFSSIGMGFVLRNTKGF